MYFVLALLTFCSGLGFVATRSGTILVGELAARINTLEEQCTAQNVQFKGENKQLNEQLERLRITLEKQENQIAHLQDEIKDLRQTNAERTVNVQTGLKRSTRFVVDESSNVAFHATLAGGYAIQHLHINQTIIFDNVMLNIGGAYHSQHGLFVANTPGIYIFSVSIMAISGGSDSTMVFIMKNGKEMAAAIADGRGAPHDQGSTTVVLQLVPGDEVWVSVQRHDDTAIWTDSLDSFMGCLIAFTS